MRASTENPSKVESSSMSKPYDTRPKPPIEKPAQESLVMGLIGGMAAAIICAAIWAVITIATGYQIGFMAIGVGFAVGYAIRFMGNGRSTAFGTMGALLSLAGCVLGNILMISYFVATQEGVPYLHVLTSLSPSIVVNLLRETFDAMDLLFYGIALYYGYTLSIHQPNENEEDIVEEESESKSVSA